MIKPLKLALLGTVGLLALTACSQGRRKVTDPTEVYFLKEDINQESFGGLGVEWGAYEDTDKLIEGGWDLVLRHMDHLGAARIRLMINYDWFCQNFDDKGDYDKTNDTWTYNYTNKYAKNMIEILEYCQTNNIDVAFGAWNVIGNLNADVWNMMDEVTSDIRWAKISADTLDFLVNKKGFTCIKWFVNSNEPNWKGAQGSSKNFYNTYEKWAQGVKNVRKALDDIGLNKVGIVGGDTTGFEGCEEYLLNISKGLKNEVADYGAHLYVSNIMVDRGEMQAQIDDLYKRIKKNDKRLGKTIQADIWEGGLRDGKTILDCQTLIATPNYAVRMTDYTLQALGAGINGICYWDFDDAMHFMYNNNSVTPKEWGMFSSLSEASAGEQELRPWYHTSSLMCHLFKKGNKILTPVLSSDEENQTFRSVATVNQDGTQGGFVAVNAGFTSVNKRFFLTEPVSGDKTYVYIFNEDSYRLGDDGYIIPNYVIDKSINNEFKVEIPSSTVVVFSNERLQFMKKRFLLLALLLGFTACAGNKSTITPKENIDIKNYEETKTGDLGDFQLLTPGQGQILEVAKTFTWEECANAEKYTLELSSSESFISDLDNIDYYSAKNIHATSFTINSDFEFKDTTYYWRVTAYNSAHNKKCASVFSFYVKAPEVEEVHFDLGEADDWTLHPQGSYADIDMVNEDFFGNGEKSIEIKFKKEDTNQGKPESDGWIIVTKTIEKSIYGTDALYFNMFYAGQQADVVIRMVDRDNEYWYCPVQVSNNAKQAVILKFEDFIQRKKDVPVANEVFDYERIKYLEIVFEKSFGDGVFLLSGMKAIKFSNYGEFFIDKLDFSDYDASAITFDTYQYNYAINGTELVLNHYNTQTEEHNKINGYGFFKVNVNRYFVTGDAIRVKVKRSGSSGSNIIVRLYEEDTDRWSYKIPYSTIGEEYRELIIPYGAWQASSLMGDGRRQFYYVLNLQFGCEGQYGNGTLYFKDFEIINLRDYVPASNRVVNSDGMIDNFNNYTYSADMFMIWEHSIDNKDEYMTINSANKLGGSSNPYCGQFEYKSDMMEAMYYLPVETIYDFDGFSIWMKDASVKPGESKVDHVTNWSPQVRLLIRLSTSEIYEYIINPLPTIWNEYNVRFEDFRLTNDDELKVPANPISAPAITHIGFAFQYYYYDSTGRAMPMYSMQNPVYVDNIKFSNNTETNVIAKDKVIVMEDNISKFDDFEDYANDDDVMNVWSNAKSFDYQLIKLSNDVSSEGGNHSVAFQFKSHNDSPSYSIAPAVNKDVRAKAVRFNAKCSVPATIFFNIYLKIGSSTQQYRATINAVANVWTEYEIGFSINNPANFSVVEGTSSRALIATDMPMIQKVTFGAVYNGDAQAALYDFFIDNLEFDYSLSYGTNNVRTIDQEVNDYEIQKIRKQSNLNKESF